ncbi:acyltransferase family protein [Parablautia muri]|uniref:Acyltransferase n=1 Tax=Parablautia muri TaxID=2320879 RepID=A0A9X5GPZ2_9FIRM|nr:acyltransferase [Parablautia muri]NBJ91253.1 acyltransferase [Parablautia muri]
MTNENNIDLNKGMLEHNYGIDALRILSMFMVVVAHILGPGGVLAAAEPRSIQYEAAWFLEIAAYCSVNCYALISGYVGIYAKYKYQNIVMLWLRVVFYTLSITLLFSILIPDAVLLKDWIKAVFPITRGYYWYFTAYFALFFFIPILNMAISKMTKNQHRAVTITLISVFSFWPTLFHKDVFGTSSNAWWLIILYIIGSYIRKYGLFQKSNALTMFLGYITVTALTWLSKFIIESQSLAFLNFIDQNYLFNNTSITMLMSGVFLLITFERIHIGHTVTKIIQCFSPAAFSVYLIHANPFVWNYLIKGRFSFQAKLPVLLGILTTLLIAALIFISCSFIDLIRSGIFKALKLQKFIGAAEDRYCKNLWS